MTKVDAQALAVQSEEAADEIEEARQRAIAEKDYRENRWFVNLAPMQTTCRRCGAVSPIVHGPIGQLAFGGPLTKRDGPDVTAAVQRAFAKIGWQFLDHRSYCPNCKNLGMDQ